MDEEDKKNLTHLAYNTCTIADNLERIANALETLLKYTEMSL